MNRRQAQQAFTLLEIMIVVAIIGMLAAVAIPAFVKARKQSQGRRILNDIRQLDAAIDQWILEKNKKDGDDILWTNEAGTYVKNPQNYSIPANNELCCDTLGNPYSLGLVGTNQILVSSTTKSALAGVGIDWGAY